MRLRASHLQGSCSITCTPHLLETAPQSDVPVPINLTVSPSSTETAAKMRSFLPGLRNVGTVFLQGNTKALQSVSENQDSSCWDQDNSTVARLFSL